MVPLADVDAKVPGVMVSVVAPAVAQLNVLAPPVVILVGLALNELMDGRLGSFTVTVSVAVVVPVVLVAVRVYMVVVVGLKVMVPVAEFEEKVPGETATLVAPDVVQLKVVLAPAVMVSGLAENVLMTGAATCGMVGNAWVQPDSNAAMINSSTAARISIADRLSSRTPALL